MQKKLNGQLFRSIKQQQNKNYSIDSQQHLKSLISDYIIKQCYSKTITPQSKTSSTQSHRPISKTTKHPKQTYTLPINILHKDTPINIQLHMILKHYITICSELIQNTRPFDQIISNVMQFIENLLNMRFDVDQHRIQVIQDVIKEEIKQFGIQRKRFNFDTEYDRIGKDLQPKNRKVLFMKSNKNVEDELTLNENTERNSQRVSRKSVISFESTQRYRHNKAPHQTKSKLKTLINHCNVFTHPQKLQALRKEMLIKQFCKNGEIEYREIKKQAYFFDQNPKNSNLQPQTIKFLISWINQISVSEALFQNLQKSKSANGKKQKMKDVSVQESQNSIAA